MGFNDDAVVGDLVGSSAVGYVTGAHVGFTEGDVLVGGTVDG